MKIDKKTYDSRNNLTVLLLEDSPLLASVIRGFLFDAGLHNVVLVKNLIDAGNTLESRPIDLVVVDADNQKEDVISLLKTARKIQRYETLPFLVVSGESNIDDIRQILAFGHATFLVKPFNENIFLEKLDTALKPDSPSQAASAKSKLFNSKILLIGTLECDFLSGDESSKVITCSDVEEAIAHIQQDVECDICVLDEEIAKLSPQRTRQLLDMQEMGQIELILMLSDMSNTHINNVEHLGIKYFIEKRYSHIYLKQLVPLIVARKRTLLDTNSLVKQLSKTASEGDDLRDSVLKQILNSSQSIKENLKQISAHKGLSKYIIDLTKDSSYNAESISFWAEAVESSQIKPTEKESDNVSLKETLGIASHLLQKLVSERKISLSIEAQQDETLQVNPVLFNSLFMFLLQAFLREVKYNSEVVITNNKDEEGVTIQITGEIEHHPILKSIASSIQFDTTDQLQVSWSDPIDRLIKRCKTDISIDYSHEKQCFSATIQIKEEK